MICSIERVEEINLYFEALKELDSESFQRTENAQHYYNDNFIKILKANTLLMIYNLVNLPLWEEFLKYMTE